MKKIFITGTGGDVAAGIVKCIRSGMPDADIFSCDIKEIVPFLNFFKMHFVVPKFNSDRYWPVLQSICIKHQITHFFPTTEPEILIADKNRDFFKKNGIKLVINNHQILEIATSKYKTAKVLRENGLCVPETYLPENLPDSLPYPLIVKPDFGRGSAYIAKVNNYMELKKAITSISSPVIQQYIGTAEEEYTLGVFSDRQTIHSMAFRRKLGRGNMSVFVEVVQDERLDSISKQIAKLFQLKGAINIQLRHHQGQYCVFEINPRISSTVSFRHQLGFQDVIWWLKCISGEPISCSYTISPGTIGIKVDSEQFFTSTENVTKF